MAITLPPPLSRDWDAGTLWLAATRDFPVDSLAVLYTGEWQKILSRAIAETKQVFNPIIGNNYMTRALLTQVDGEIDTSALRIDFSDIRRVKLEVTIANVMTLADLITLNSQSLEHDVVVGEQWIEIPHNMLGTWVLDDLTINGSPTNWEILSVEPTRIKIKTVVAGKARLQLGRVGTKLSGATIVNSGAAVQPIRLKIRAAVAVGLTTVEFVHAGHVVTMVGDYEVSTPYTEGIAAKVVEQNSTYMVVTSPAACTIECEVIGNALYGGIVVNAYEQRIRQSLLEGENIVTFSLDMPSDYAILTNYAYNANGASVPLEITDRSISGFIVRTTEDCTGVFRVSQVGVVYETLPIAPSPQAKTVLVETYEEFAAFRQNAKHNERTVVYWMGGGDRLFVKKGYGLAGWGSFIAYYPRVPYVIKSTTDKPDVPDGVYMEYVRLRTKELVAERCGIEAKPAERMALVESEYRRAGITLKTETVEKENLRKTQ